MTKAEEKFERAKLVIFRLKEQADRQGVRVTLKKYDQGKAVMFAATHNDKVILLLTHLRRVRRTSCVRKAEVCDWLDQTEKRIPWREGVIKAEVSIEGRANRLAFEKKLRDRVGE